MSAIAASLVSRLSGLSLSPSRHDSTDTDSVISSQDTCSSSEASSSAGSSSKPFDTRSCLSDSVLSASPRETTIPFQPRGLRAKEHLAVLLPKELWKPDSQATRCDTFLCSKKFSVFERRHHCRKCGGIFCAACTTRATLLLDTSTLPFLNPPRGVAVAAFASPDSPVGLARVCDECFDQIHGTHHSRSLTQKKERSQSLQWDLDCSSSSSASSSPRSPPTPLDGSAIVPMPAMRRPLLRAHTSPRVPTLGTLPPAPGVSDELAAYPLCRASAICKATGGGRWEPKPHVEIVGLRQPGRKAAYEIEMEREEAEQRRLKSNPIIRDGDFQLRPAREFAPRSLGGPIQLSTF